MTHRKRFQKSRPATKIDQIDPRVTPQRLHGTLATLGRNVGHSSQHAADMLGHATPAITERACIDSERAAAAARRHAPIRAQHRRFDDRARVLQVFSNLVGNALKFTADGGHITLRARREGNLVQFSVADTGKGIAAEQLPHIFTPYWQVRKADRAGIGLGLAIAKGIIEAHGGAISVESAAGGTTFTFSLPVAHGGFAVV